MVPLVRLVRQCNLLVRSLVAEIDHPSEHTEPLELARSVPRGRAHPTPSPRLGTDEELAQQCKCQSARVGPKLLIEQAQFSITSNEECPRQDQAA